MTANADQPGIPPPPPPRRKEEVDEVDEASIESFPGSDPPSFTPVNGTGAPRKGPERR